MTTDLKPNRNSGFSMKYIFSLLTLSFIIIIGLNSCGEEHELIANQGYSDLEYNYEGGVDLPEGLDLVIYEPKGELKYYEATKTTLGSKNEVKYIVPVVKATDGYTYIRNLTGEEIPNGIGIWIKCTPDEENNRLIIPSKSPYGYDILNSYTASKIYDADSNESIFDGVHSLYSVYRYSKYFNTVNIDTIYPDIILEIKADGVMSLHNDNLDTKGVCGKPYGRNTIMKAANTIRSLVLSPSEFSCTTPPRNSTHEKWQLKYNSLTYIPEGYREPENDAYKKGVVLNCGINNNEIFFQGLSDWDINGDPETCIKGEIRNGKVIFHNGVCFGITNDGKPLYLSVFKSEITDDGCTLIPTQEDLIFDYDQVNGVVSNPNLCFGITTKIFDRENDMDDSSLLRVFYNAEFKRISDDLEQIPQSPIVESIWQDIIYHRVLITNIDNNGNVIDPEKLYIKCYSKGKEIALYDYRDNRSNKWKERYGECILYKVPYNLLDSYPNSQRYFTTGIIGFDHYLVYLKDGKEIFSEKAIYTN